VSIVPELSTTALLAQPVRLVAFPSIDGHQLDALRSVLQPSYMTLITGVSPRNDLAWREDAIREINHIDMLSGVEDRSASIVDYRETIDVILDCYAMHGDLEKLVVCPTGSKMQAVSVGIVRGFLSDIQIAYPTSRSFLAPKQYSEGVGQLYTLDLSSVRQGL
jgi:hypothetical protein